LTRRSIVRPDSGQWLRSADIAGCEFHAVFYQGVQEEKVKGFGSAELVIMEDERDSPRQRAQEHAHQHAFEASQHGIDLNETHFRALLDLIPVAVCVADGQGRCQYANERWLSIVDLTLDEALGDGWLSHLHPDDQERIAAAWYGAVGAGDAWEGECRVRTPAGKVKWVQIAASPLHDDQSRVTGYIGTAVDISASKYVEEQLRAYSASLEASIKARTSELETAHEQLIRREKLVALGQLAGSVSHELRNPLSVIYNAAYYLQMMLDEADAATKEYLQLIAATAREAETIITDLLDFSRTRTAERGPVALDSLIDNVLVKHPAPDDVQVTLDVTPDLPLAWADARQIGQVLDNLVTNAYQAMDEGGTLTLTARADHDRVSLTVTDTGCGISPDDQAHIFEPLFTTKTHGIGLGLALSKNYIELNDGTIGFESTPGAGCTFTISLPVHDHVGQ
jgi:PAS domain S-box-containing protein